MLPLFQIERERDDLKAHLSDYKKQLKAQNEEMAKNEAKLKSTLINLRQVSIFQASR